VRRAGRGKRRYDAFLGTDLETLLRARKIENLVVAGTSRERHEAALLCLGHVFAYVASLTEVEGALSRLVPVGD